MSKDEIHKQRPTSELHLYLANGAKNGKIWSGEEEENIVGTFSHFNNKLAKKIQVIFRKEELKSLMSKVIQT